MIVYKMMVKQSRRGGVHQRRYFTILVFIQSPIVYSQARSSDAKFEETMDRVEAAFKKFDTDGNGYIDWDEFKEVNFCLRSKMISSFSEIG